MPSFPIYKIYKCNKEKSSLLIARKCEMLSCYKELACVLQKLYIKEILKNYDEE